MSLSRTFTKYGSIELFYFITFLKIKGRMFQMVWVFETENNYFSQKKKTKAEKLNSKKGKDGLQYFFEEKDLLHSRRYENQ